METESERNEREANEAGSTIVGAVGTAVGNKVSGSDVVKRLEAAMVKAVEACHEAGINDPDEIKAAKAKALEEERAAIDAEEAED